MDALSFEEYAAMGGAADAAVFPLLEARARRLVDQKTHGRLGGESPLRQTAKYCLLSLIDAMAADRALDGGTGRDVASVSNDGVSVSYVSYASTVGANMAEARYLRIIREWLGGETTAEGVQLLYAGVDA